MQVVSSLQFPRAFRPLGIGASRWLIVQKKPLLNVPLSLPNALDDFKFIVIYEKKKHDFKFLTPFFPLLAI